MRKAVIFDLDDTLYKEIDFLQSGFVSICNKISEHVKDSSKVIYDKLYSYYLTGEDAFYSIIVEYALYMFRKKDLINLYRNHIPNIKLSSESIKTLEQLTKDNYSIGLLTDGRSVQQYNKIKSLNLKKYISEILISEEFGSEKPNKNNYLYFSESKYSNCDKFYYVGDNVIKDFITPNSLGWTTICIKNNGQNIHKQNFNVDKKYLPHHIVNNLLDIIPLIHEK